jgi:hypothetical protein
MMPTNRFSWFGTGRQRMPFSCMIRAASATSWSSKQQTTCGVIAAVTPVSQGLPSPVCDGTDG